MSPRPAIGNSVPEPAPAVQRRPSGQRLRAVPFQNFVQCRALRGAWPGLPQTEPVHLLGRQIATQHAVRSSCVSKTIRTVRKNRVQAGNALFMPREPHMSSSISRLRFRHACFATEIVFIRVRCGDSCYTFGIANPLAAHSAAHRSPKKCGDRADCPKILRRISDKLNPTSSLTRVN